jgi:hypothetical protein
MSNVMSAVYKFSPFHVTSSSVKKAAVRRTSRLLYRRTSRCTSPYLRRWRSTGPKPIRSISSYVITLPNFMTLILKPQVLCHGISPNSYSIEMVRSSNSPTQVSSPKSFFRLFKRSFLIEQ